jgi:hypothetical protein
LARADGCGGGAQRGACRLWGHRGLSAASRVNKEIGSRKYGIELEPLLIGGGALNMQALVSGSIQLSQNSASSAIQPALRGAPIVILAIQESRMPFQIVARPEIKAPEQLIGKKIRIQRDAAEWETDEAGRGK